MGRRGALCQTTMEVVSVTGNFRLFASDANARQSRPRTCMHALGPIDPIDPIGPIGINCTSGTNVCAGAFKT